MHNEGFDPQDMTTAHLVFYAMGLVTLVVAMAMAALRM